MAASAPAGRAIFVGAKRPEPGQHLQSDRERGNGQWRVTMLPVSEATSSLIELAARRAVSPRPRPERSISKRCFVSETEKKACQDILDRVSIGVGEESVEAIRSMTTMRSFVQSVDC